MNPIRSLVADLCDGLVALTHLAAAVAGVRLLAELADPTRTVAAVWIVLGMVAVAIADAVITVPLHRAANLVRSITRL